MSERRNVRVTRAFWQDLDSQLNSERGPNGEPSAIDFQSIEVVEIMERFATGFDTLPPLFEGRADYRVLVKGGLLFRGMKVLGIIANDGVIELVGLELDLHMDWD